MTSLGSDPKSLNRRPEKKSELLGQVITPSNVAMMMVKKLYSRSSSGPVSILDPAVGPATFPLALKQIRALTKNDTLFMYDIDKEMLSKAEHALQKTPCKRNFYCKDYLLSNNNHQFDLAILNPPYIRQEWIDNKDQYRRIFKERYDLDIPGTANLYVYFIIKVLQELKEGGWFSCIIYDSWKFTKYGKWLASILETSCEEIEIISVGTQPFDGHLIDASVFFAKRSVRNFVSYKPQKNKNILQNRLSSFEGVAGFSRIDNLYDTIRGLRLKQANFFLSDLEGVKRYDATPFVKKIGSIKGFSIPDEHNESALIISKNTNLKEKIIVELKNRLEQAKLNPERNVSILTWYRERPTRWYLHREVPIAPILFNYYLRNRPRHIFNRNRAYSDNFYGLTPKLSIDPVIPLGLLNSTCVCIELLSLSRNQGNGLAKIQLFEYREAYVPDWSVASKKFLKKIKRLSYELLSCAAPLLIIDKIDSTIASEYQEEILKQNSLIELYRTLNERETNRKYTDGLA